MFWLNKSTNVMRLFFKLAEYLEIRRANKMI